MTVDDKIIERIRKLLTLGDTGKNDSENEAMRAMERAHALMREHGIELADLNTGDSEEGFDIGVVCWRDEEKSQYDTWVRMLAGATAELFSIQNILFRSGSHNRYRVRLAFVGEEFDVEMAKNVWPWLVKHARRGARRYGGQGWGPTHRTFCEAFAARVHERAEEIAAASIAAASAGETEDDQKYGLVVAAKEDALALFMQQNFPKLRTSHRRLTGQHDPFAAGAGAAEGDKVNLNFRTQLGGGDQGSGGTRLISG